jgi:hypothetical protein
MKQYLIGITGYRGHGKSTAAQVLESAGWRHFNFSDTLKEVVQLVYGIPLEIQNHAVLKEEVWPYYPHKSPRELLQYIGTDMFRNYIADTWIEAWRRRSMMFSHVVVSDVRFPNEADVITEMGGIVIRVHNPDIRHTDAASKHASELEIDKIKPTYMITNDGTIGELQARIQEIATRFVRQ